MNWFLHNPDFLSGDVEKVRTVQEESDWGDTGTMNLETITEALDYVLCGLYSSIHLCYKAVFLRPSSGPISPRCWRFTWASFFYFPLNVLVGVLLLSFSARAECLFSDVPLAKAGCEAHWLKRTIHTGCEQWIYSTYSLQIIQLFISLKQFFAAWELIDCLAAWTLVHAAKQNPSTGKPLFKTLPRSRCPTQANTPTAFAAAKCVVAHPWRGL